MAIGTYIAVPTIFCFACPPRRKKIYRKQKLQIIFSHVLHFNIGIENVQQF